MAAHELRQRRGIRGLPALLGIGAGAVFSGVKLAAACGIVLLLGLLHMALAQGRAVENPWRCWRRLFSRRRWQGRFGGKWKVFNVKAPQPADDARRAVSRASRSAVVAANVCLCVGGIASKPHTQEVRRVAAVTG